MSWAEKITTSIFGRRLGLQHLSSSQSGGSRGQIDLLVGAEAVKPYVSSAETTAANLPAYGVSILTTGAGGSTNTLYKLDPPIPGVSKTIVIASTNTATNMITVQTSTGATVCFTSSAGSTFCTISSSGGSQSAFTLVGINSTQWGTVSPLTTAAFALSTTT
jgi:hypothetical protein